VQSKPGVNPQSERGSQGLQSIERGEYSGQNNSRCQIEDGEILDAQRLILLEKHEPSM
jgi:hypothetical protein